MLAVPEKVEHETVSQESVSIEFVAARNADALRDAWLELANDAVEPNYFYSPGFLLAAFRHLPDQDSNSLLVVWHFSGGARRLIGLIPLMKSTFYWGLPIPLLHSWLNPYGSYTAPLLRKGFERRAAEALLDGLARSKGRQSAIYLHRIDPDGPAFQAIRQALDARGQQWRKVRALERTVATPPEDFEAFLAENMSSKRRYNYRKAVRDLAKKGEVSFEVASTSAEVDAALDAFMALEKASWKGDQGSAMASKTATVEFLREAYRAGTGETRAVVHSLCLDGRKIAINILAKSGDVLWTPKIATDAAYHKCAPGILLAMDVVRSVGHELGAKRIDSATKPGSWVDAYWGERQQLADIIVATTPAKPGYLIDGFVRLDKIRRDFGPRLREKLQQGQALLRSKTGRRRG